MRPKHLYQWKHLDQDPDPPWLVGLAAVLWAVVVVLSMFI